jgi:hypothetical protein
MLPGGIKRKINLAGMRKIINSFITQGFGLTSMASMVLTISLIM